MPPFSRMVLETSGLAEPTPDPLHAVGRCVPGAVVARRHRGHHGRCDRRCVDARPFPRGDRAGGVRRPAAADQDRSRARRRPRCWQRLEALNPAAQHRSMRDGGRSRRGAVRWRPCGDPAAAARFVGDGRARAWHSRRSSRAAPADDAAAISRVALGGLAREHGEDLLRVKGIVAFADRRGRAGGDPCRAAHAVSAALARRLAGWRSRQPAGVHRARHRSRDHAGRISPPAIRCWLRRVT